MQVRTVRIRRYLLRVCPFLQESHRVRDLPTYAHDRGRRTPGRQRHVVLMMPCLLMTDCWPLIAIRRYRLLSNYCLNTVGI